MRIRPIAPLAALACAAGGCGLIAAAGVSAEPGESLPDLVPVLPASTADPAYANARVDRSTAPGRALLRFDGVLRNIGAGRFELAGSRADTTTDMAAEQVVYGVDGVTEVRRKPLANPIYWEAADGHTHWHYRRATDYRLWTPAGPGEHEVGPSAKIGFCMFDTYDLGAAGSPYYLTCGTGKDDLAMRMGISPTWGDMYQQGLALQWIDVTGVTPGPYRLRAEIDPDQQIDESDESNQVVWADTYVDGVVAAPVDAGAVPAGGALAVTLRGEARNSPTTLPAQRLKVTGFQLVTPPEHGVVQLPAPGTSVATYRPSAGYAGPDHFTYRATGSLGAVSAPAAVDVQVAPVPPVEPPAPVPTTGSAPAPPAAPAGPATAGVAPAAAGSQAPAATIGTPAAVREVLAVRAVRRRSRVAIRVSAERRGVVRVVVRSGGRLAAGCVRTVRPGRPATCALTLGPRARSHLAYDAVLAARARGAALARLAGPVT